MKFQTLIAHKANTNLYLNGRVVPIDAFGVIEVTTDADIAQLKAMSREWSDVVQKVEPRGPITVTTVKTVDDLIRDVQTDADLFTKLSNMRSPVTRRSWLESRGYRFTDADLEIALGARQPAPTPPAPTAATPAAAPVPSPKEAPKAAATWAIPEEGGEWPDPTVEMPLEYLKAMASAYDVKCNSKTKPEDLVSRIHAAMYPPEK